MAASWLRPSQAWPSALSGRSGRLGAPLARKSVTSVCTWRNTVEKPAGAALPALSALAGRVATAPGLAATVGRVASVGDIGRAEAMKKSDWRIELVLAVQDTLHDAVLLGQQFTIAHIAPFAFEH